MIGRLGKRAAALTIATLGPLFLPAKTRDAFNRVRAFCLFIGHGRSGSTLVGSLLDAHPRILIANELNVFKYLDHGKWSREQIFTLLWFRSAWLAWRGSPGGGGYRYRVPGQWQGRHDRVRVMGERTAGVTATRMAKTPEVLERLQSTVRIPIKFINVVRNPFDNIATDCNRSKRLPGDTEAEHLERRAREYFWRWSAVLAVEREFGPESFFRSHHREFLRDPVSRLAKLCEFLGVEADAGYLEACRSVVELEPRRTRDSVRWTSETRRYVEEQMAKVPPLRRYSYDSD